ncbi:MAG TPA: hypothetical protein VFP65_15215 [Anaeromyxobacteraceae bacterium]|nr:hypothetical protein [Anaeromyxobacteraceae bacterium]
MRLSVKLTSNVVLAVVACCALGAASAARAQSTANLAVVVTPPDATPIDTSGTPAVTVDITNNGPSNATGVVVDATFPAEVEIASVDGCTANDTSATAKPLPCTVNAQTLGAGVIPQNGKAKVTITFAVTSAAAKTITGATTCNPPATLGTVTVNVTSTTTSAGPNSGTAQLPGIAKFADLSVTYAAVDGTGKPLSTANEGDTVKFDGTVTNNGPCPAPGVVLTTATTLMTFVDGTGVCPGDPAEDDCSIGDMAVGASVAFSRRYKIDPPPGADAATGSYAHFSEVDVSSNDVKNGTVTTPAAWDPNTDDDTARPIVTSSHSAGGCASGGRGVDAGVLAVLPVLLLLARVQRRRAAAKR